jgi:hypothetical protein
MSRGKGKGWSPGQNPADLTPEQQAERRPARKRSKAARKGRRRGVPAQMDHASGKRKQARQGRQRLDRDRNGGRL